MKRGKEDTSRNAFVLVLLVLIGLLLIFAFTNRNIWNRLTGKAATESAQVSATVNNVGPSINTNNLDGTATISPLEGSTRYINISFRVQDNNGYNDISTASASTFVSIAKGATVRQSSPGSCTKSSGGTPKRADINCTVPIEFYDENATDWIVTVSVGDIGGLSASDAARTVAVALLRSVSLATTPPAIPITLNFTTLAPGAVNQGAANDPLNILNNGNYQGQLRVLGSDLSNGIDVIPANNFSVHNATGEECASSLEGGTATQLSGVAQIVVNSSVPRGPLGSNTGQLFFCADGLPDPLSSGVYSTAPLAPWSIEVP